MLTEKIKILLMLCLSVFAMPSYSNMVSGSKGEWVSGSVVSLENQDGNYQLICNGKPFYIKGAGLEYGNMESLAKHGGNAFRTWTINNGVQSGQEVLDEAYKNGLMVCMGIEVGRERHGFDYNNDEMVQKQLDQIRKDVMALKDHPALLMWGIGNELNLNYTNPKVWDAVNNIAIMIEEIDPNHPTTTMLAGAGKEEIRMVVTKCPALDLISFQLYGDIVNLPQYLQQSNYKGAYIVSEWGATGHWEVETTAWGRPIEQNSHIKAMAYKDRYEKVIASDPEQCIGSFVFLWGQKQERTPTWYGIFLENGEETEAVDVMHFLWNNKWPDNLSPQMNSLTLNGQVAYNSILLKKGQTCQSVTIVQEPDNNQLTYTWIILKEVPEAQQSEGGDFEKKPETLMEKTMNSGGDTIEFKAPDTGEYRLFVYASDGKGKAATANIPFKVE